MEIFIRDIPYHATQRDVENAFEPKLEKIGILAWAVRVFVPGRKSGKKVKLGTLTLPTAEAGQRFLRCHGQGYNNSPPREQLWVSNRKITCVISNNPPEPLMVKSLAKEQQDNILREERRGKSIDGHGPGLSTLTKTYIIDLVECGIWSPRATNLPTFEAYYSKNVDGKLTFKPKGATIEFQDDKLDIFDPASLGPELCSKFGDIRIDKEISILYPTVSSIITSEAGSGRVTFTLTRAPRMYRKIVAGKKHNADADMHMDDFLRVFKQLLVLNEEEFPLERISAIDEDHACFAAFAFVYQFRLKERSDLKRLKDLSLKNGVPEINFLRTDRKFDPISFVDSFQKLTRILRTDFDFPIAFQLNALLANGVLPPYSIISLLPHVSELVMRFGTAKAASIMQDFVRWISPADPLGEVDSLSQNNLFDILVSRVCDFERLQSPISSAEQASGGAEVTYIYHTTITPAGCYFYGPSLETQNRVLRKYPNHHGFFLRVFFGEEDGDQLMFEHNVVQSLIYDGQFRNYLSPSGKGIVIADRNFQFLGFSSSSLRTSSCWFMAPFVFNGENLDAAKLISNLGDFSQITCPGRCAARIGQAFSDTVGSIEVPPESEIEIEDIERGGRCFSDGVGKISQEMLEVIWNGPGSEKLYKNKSTVFQIRFSGAKGVVALDTRLKGMQICLRPSMIKFRGSTDRNIEICSTPGWLPMVLNRPLIKVLEDLDVRPETFMDLQRDAINELRDSTRSPSLAANFLKRHRVAPASVKLPWMIEALHNIGLNFRNDEFLERALELALLTALRDLKHRARIPVPDGVTLIGIVDETGFLKEGEIFCPYRFDDGEEGVVEGNVLITRSPVHHPGDVQMAKAVSLNSIPENSPLRALKNVVVFSQQGSRGLPSMLSGGDLDGDLYNIIYDPRFSLGKIYSPAEYPRVQPKDLGRAVTLNDIVDFLIDFMQNNIVGLISTRHLIISDREKEGVKHPDCLKLAEMASTAVDFPKTGIKVNRAEMPRSSRVRPDFLAPGPRVIVRKNRAMAEVKLEGEDEEGGDTYLKYYESEKVLGHLYRAIDERQFIYEIKAELDRSERVVSVSDGIWNYLLDNIPKVYDWTERINEAQDIKESYEGAMLNMMRNYADTPWSGSISEVEVFIGTIVGRDKQTQRQKDASIDMKDEFEGLVGSIINSIKGDQDDRADVFGVGMACLFLCRSDVECVGPRSGLRSFAWVVTSALLTEVDRYQKQVKRSRNVR